MKRDERVVQYKGDKNAYVFMELQEMKQSQ